MKELKEKEGGEEMKGTRFHKGISHFQPYASHRGNSTCNYPLIRQWLDGRPHNAMLSAPLNLITRK